MNEVKDIVVFEFSGDRVKTVIREVAYAERVRRTDEYVAQGYACWEVPTPTSIKPGDKRSDIRRPR